MVGVLTSRGEAVQHLLGMETGMGMADGGRGGTAVMPTCSPHGKTCPSKGQFMSRAPQRLSASCGIR